MYNEKIEFFAFAEFISFWLWCCGDLVWVLEARQHVQELGPWQVQYVAV